MRRVEIFGVEGIGKTTLYKELVKRRKRRDNWRTLDEASIRVAYKYAKECNKISFIHLIAPILLRIPIHRTIRSYLCDQLLQIPQKEVVIQNRPYSMFFQAIINFCNVEQYNPQLRLYRATNLYSTSCRIMYLENHISSDIFVIEGETISIYGLLLSHQLDESCEDLAKNFFLNIPPPAGLIYCKLDPEKTIERIQKRNKDGIITIAHRDPEDYNSLIETSQLRRIIKYQNIIADIGIKVLRNRGVRILVIDMEDTLEKNISKIQKYLHEM
jgi:thymidylate kinase